MAAAHPVHAPVLYDENEKKYIHYPGRQRLGPLPKGILDPERRTVDMDRQRVDIQVITVPSSQFYYHTPPEVAVDFVRLQNDALIELSDSMPDRLHLFAILPLQDVRAAIQEVVRLAEHPRVRGVTVGTNVNGLYFHEPIFDPLWDELDLHNLPVWIQPDQRSVAGADRLNVFYFENFLGNPIDSTIACASLIFGGVVERHPALRFGFVHGGGFAPYQIGRWDHGWNVREEARRFIPDKPPRDYLRRMYFDSLTHDTDSLGLLGRCVGWDHVVLGSDYPFDMASSDPVGDVDKLGLEETERAAVLGQNAERFLRPIGGKP
jgi:aminocarboxymuconate-semialdehyde decarboxylase